MFATDLEDGIDVERLAVQMHGHDGFGAGRDGALDQFWIEIERGVVDVDEHWRGADVRDGPARGDEGLGRGDDFVALADVEEQERDMERGGAAIEADAMFGVSE